MAVTAARRGGHRARPRASRRQRLGDYLRYRPGLRVVLAALVLVVVLLVVLGALAAFRLRHVAGDLHDARATLQRVQTELEAGQVGAAHRDLVASEERLAHANSNLYAALPFDLVSWIPVVHQNLAALRHAVGLASTIVSGGADVLQDAAPLQGPTGKLDVSLRQGGVPLAVLTQADAGLEVLADALPTPNQRPSSSLLFGPVSRAQDEIFDEAVGRRSQVVNLARAVDLLDDMAGANGPRRYLIAVANTAEERGSGGMILAYGELDSSDGNFALGSFGGVEDIPVLNAPATTLPEDYQRRWQGFSYLTNWRQANLGADFPTVAPTLVNMYDAATTAKVDGVIQIDPAGLAAILKGTGPVDVPGVGTVTAANVVDITLNQAYLEHPNRTERQDVSAAVAKAVFQKLVGGTYSSLRPLATALSDAVAGRHIQMWTSHPGAQDDLAFFDATGALPPADAPAYSLVVENTGQNKLDYYLDTALGITGSLPTAGQGHLDVAVTLHNTAPADGTNQEVFGPNGAGQVRGVYRGIVSLYVPASTNLTGVDGDATVTPPTVFSEGGHEVMSYEVAIPPGGSSQVVLHLAPLARQDEPPLLLLVPQPRVRPTSVLVGVDLAGHHATAARALDRSYLVVAGSAPVPASGPTGVRVFAAAPGAPGS